jgi:hypothetical protein
MAVRRETFGPDGMLLDVVDAVYDAQRYYQAEISRDRTPTTSSSHPRKIVETDHASSPRLGSWSDRDGGNG